MKDVCILSMQRIQNCGSVLQAYGLKKMLEKFGADVYFLDIKKNEADNELMRGIEVESLESNYYNLSFIESCQLKKNWKMQALHFLLFRKRFLNLKRKKDIYDLCIIGSDEVFNCMYSGWWGFTSQLFGNVPEAKKVVTYAASCGATRYEMLPDKVKTKIKESFCNISSFSVRDDNTKEFTTKMTTNQVNFNLDPALVYDFSNELKNTKLPRVSSKYCLIYAYPNRLGSEDEHIKILEFCNKHSLTPVSVCTSHFWCKKHIICSPFETLKLFENADFVITDTFHGAIFSIKYARKFAVLIRESNYNKLKDLTDRVGVSQHVVNEINQLETIYNIDKNRDIINKTIEKERERTLAYLGDCLDESRTK